MEAVKCSSQTGKDFILSYYVLRSNVLMLFRIILNIISNLSKPIDGTQTSSTTLGQLDLGVMEMKGLIHTLQTSRTEASPLDARYPVRTEVSKEEIVHYLLKKNMVNQKSFIT